MTYTKGTDTPPHTHKKKKLGRKTQSDYTYIIREWMLGKEQNLRLKEFYKPKELYTLFLRHINVCNGCFIKDTWLLHEFQNYIFSILKNSPACAPKEKLQKFYINTFIPFHPLIKLFF